ncbi:hypothetical protein [Nocardia sp. R7R-8]|uniref:hypothetical protein n=1 Tax=Nocardia sp. R7R-8 TaxID=3459304 RepID=UPI00403DC948
MIVTLVTADSAQPDPSTGKAHALGIGWSWVGTPTPPISFIAIIDRDESDLEHAEISLVFELVDVEDKLVALGADSDALRVQAVITVDQQSDRFAIPFSLGAGLPLVPGTYSWRASDTSGKEYARVGFEVRQQSIQ